MPTITGTPNDDTLVGTPSDDTINALEGNDLLEGGLGDDLLDGGGGIDTASYANAAGGVNVNLFLNGNGNGTASGADGNDSLAGIENIAGSAFNDILTGNNLANAIDGGDGNDSLRGRGGDDSLLGGGGNDFLNGGLGDDVIDGGAGFDRAAYFTDATSGVTVDLRIQGVAQDTGQGVDTLIGIEHVSGTVFGDVLTGDEGDNWIWASPATLGDGSISADNNDVLDGQGGNDLLVVGIGNHSIDGGSGIDTLSFTENANTDPAVAISLALQGAAQATGQGSWTIANVENLSGGTGNDQLTGDGTANILAGFTGDDLLVGGAGNDQLYGDGFIATDNRPTGGSGPIGLFTDAALFDPFYVDGNDTLEGGLGNDLLDGGGGIDTASYANAAGSVNVNLFLNGNGNGTASGADGNDNLAGIENIAGSAFSDILTGNNLANAIDGGDGNDTLRGRGGNDTMLGGGGNDFLNGGQGDDVVDGGAGFDRAAYYTDATAGVTVDLRIQGVAQDTGQGVDTLIGIEHVSGTVFGDVLTGDGGDNWIWASPATLGDGSISADNNDVVDGQGGNDLIGVGIGNHSIDGGSGTDTLYFTENFGDDPAVTINLSLQGSAQDTGQGSWTITNVENLSGGTGNDALTGDGNANILAGYTGNDVLVGGAGHDTLYGDGLIGTDANVITTFTDAVASFGGVSGNDLLEGGLGNDLIDGGGGIDTASYANAAGGVTVTLTASGGSSLGADGNDTLLNIENITGSAFTDTLTGNGLANVLIGGDGHDLLRGDDGNDTLLGGTGDDFLSGGMGDDLLDGGTGFDRVSYLAGATAAVTINLNIQGIAQDTVGAGMDTLIGIEHASGTIYNDTLTGNAGDNWLWGGSNGSGVTGNDLINAGAGNDLVTVGTGNHTLNGDAGVDTLSLLGNTTDITAAGITFSLALQGAAQDTEQGMMNAFGFENVSGSIHDDAITGDGADNMLAGDTGNDSLVGGAGNDTLYGDGRVVIDSHGGGGSGPITTFTDAVASFGGVSGNDLLEGGLGNDLIDGGGGIDTASYANASGGVTVNLGTGTSSGADGNDTLTNIENVTGSGFNDSLTGSGGGNVLDGLGGNDTISGGASDDTLHGGDGDDFLQGDFNENNITATGNDVMYGGNGNDLLRGGLGDDQFYGGANNDQFRGNGGVDYFDGGTDDGEGVNGIGDRVSFFEQRATQGVVADLRTGIISNDGFGNVETMVGIESLGGDTAFIDTFYGNDDRNYLAGGRGDFVYGFGGDDLFQMISATAVLDGGSGIDRLSLFISAGGQLLPDANGDGLAEFALAATAGWTVNLAAGTLVDGYGYAGTISGVENINGSELGDTLIGDGNANVFNGGGGDDLLEGGGGNDTLDGGIGTDTVSYASAAAGVSAGLGVGGSGGAFGSATGSDSFNGIENLTGSAFNDQFGGNADANVLTGNGGHDILAGRAGNDTLIGGDGDDYLRGDEGDDIIVGGAGWDRIVYHTNATGGVTIDLNQQGIAQDMGSMGVDIFTGIEHASGTTFNDTIIGDGGDNWLRSWGGDDVIAGGDGNDLIETMPGNNIADGGSGIDTWSLYAEGVQVPSGVTASLALQGAAQDTGHGMMLITGFENLSGSVHGDTLSGDSAANVIGGDQGNDNLSGGAGNDTLYGDGAIFVDLHGNGGSGPITTFVDVTVIDASFVAGNDILEGGLGDDLLYGGGGIDTASYANASGAVQVQVYNGGFGEAFGADGYDQLHDIENLTGSAFDDALTGNALANVLAGGDGNDTLRGGGGNDSLLGGNGTDFINGGFGDDLVDGGSGSDRAAYFQTNAAVGGVTVSLLLQDSWQNTGSQGLDYLIGIESLSGTPFADSLTGDAGNNWLWGSVATISVGNVSTANNDMLAGGDGNDILWVGIGNHTLIGGNGIDTLQFTENGQLVVEGGATISLALQGAAQTTGNGDWTLTGIENLSGGTGSDSLSGDANANVLAGYLGSDVLSGADGDDILLGDGIIDFDANNAAVNVFDSGTDGGNDNLSGGGGNDTLYGGAGDDLLEGGLGNDLIDGGSGIDTASYANAAGSVQVTLTATGGSSSGADGSDTLFSIENITGGAYNDTLTGNGLANVLIGGDGHDRLSGGAGNDMVQGGSGNDSLDGGAGDDVIDGGAGFDRASYNVGATAGVTVNLSLTGAQDTGRGLDTLIGIEHVVGTVFNDVLTGDAGDNWLWGGSLGTGVTGNDTISGGDGNDLIEVGSGNHSLSGGNGIDTLSFFGGGTDITAAGVTFSLASAVAQNSEQGTTTASGFENLSGSVHDDVFAGDAGNNVLAGNVGADQLSGGDGNDVLYGDGGYTTFVGGTTAGPIRLIQDVTTEFGGVGGADILDGGVGNDQLYGGGGNDVLNGGRGDDFLYGGSGNDVMSGGPGADRFIIEFASGADRITDFAHVDRIVFDALTGVDSFSDLIFTASGKNTIITWGTGDSLIVEGYRPRDLTVADFEFAAASAPMTAMSAHEGGMIQTADYLFG